MTPEEVYKEIEEKAIPFIKHYQSDLYIHDKNFIMQNPDIPFILFVREMGTHIITLIPVQQFPISDDIVVPYLFGKVTRQHLLREKMAIVEYFENPCSLHPRMILHYDGRRAVHEINLAAARNVVKRYQQNIQESWRKS